MKISELAVRADVSVPSIKFYLREGLLPPGDRTARNQAVYSEEHVRRLRLIRALIEVGSLPIATVRTVLAEVDRSDDDLHDAFGSVMHGLDRADTNSESPVDEVWEWIRSRQWSIDPSAPAVPRLASLLDTLRQFDFPVSASDFSDIAEVFERRADFAVGHARSRPDRVSAVETMVVGTVVIERIYTEVRRLALEAVSARIRDEQDRDEQGGAEEAGAEQDRSVPFGEHPSPSRL